MGMIRIKDIAKRAGVSPTTVSNVIHGNTKKVSPATIKKIQEMLKEMSYVPSMGARMLAENRSRIIGVLLGGNADKRRSGKGEAFSNMIVSSLEYEIYRKNYYMMLHISSTAEENLQLAASWNVEGLITIGLSVQENLKLQSKCKVPMVSIDNYYENGTVANIGLNDWKGGFEMGKFLVEQKFVNMLFLADNNIGVDHYRWLGFCEALKEAGISVTEKDRLLIPEEHGPRIAFYEQHQKMILSHEVLFFASDYYAAEAMNYFQDKGVCIPEEISVSGFDDSEYALLCRPLLTTVRQDVRQKGIAAVEKLFAFINGEKDVSMEEKLPIELVVRDSVKRSCSK